MSPPLLRKLIVVALLADLPRHEREQEALIARIDAEHRPTIDDIRRGLGLE
jgi:hypothetical protein